MLCYLKLCGKYRFSFSQLLFTISVTYVDIIVINAHKLILQAVFLVVLQNFYKAGNFPKELPKKNFRTKLFKAKSFDRSPTSRTVSYLGYHTFCKEGNTKLYGWT